MRRRTEPEAKRTARACAAGLPPSLGDAWDDGTARTVEAAKRGDSDAVRELYVLYADAVRRAVNRILNDEHAAEDVTQQVFEKLITAIGTFEQRAVPFAAWLMRVARNAALDDLRSRRSIPTDVLDQVLADHNAEVAIVSVLVDAIAALPADQRTVIYHRYVLGLSPAEIGRCMGRSESAVHGLHHRGRLAVRHELERLRAAPSTRERARATAVPDLELQPA